MSPRSLVLACATLAGCASEYHPDYHPETAYSTVQNVTYAQNAWVLPARPERAGAPVTITEAPPRESARGEVTSPGSVIVYGDLYGNVYVGR